MKEEKDVLYGSEARLALLRGIDKIAKAVSVTLGPAGRSVMLDRHFGSPVVTNDGVTIAKEVFLKDPFENMGAMLIRSASSKTNDVVGDGTTTSVVLAQTMIREGLKNVEAGANPVLLQKGMFKAGEIVHSVIRSMSREVKDNEDIKKIGTISSGSVEIGKLIADAMSKLPKEAIITLEDSNTAETSCDVVNGMEFDRGYITSHMVNDPKTMEAFVNNPLILITDYKITNVQDLLPIMDRVRKAGRELFIVADGIDTEPLAALVVNQMKGLFRCVLAKAPSFGDRKRDLLGDFAVVTGATVISKELGMILPDTTLDKLGSAEKVICSKDNTVIIGGRGDKDMIADRIAHVRDELELADFDYDKLKLEERLSRLNGGIGIIRVGAPTDVEQEEKKLRIEDAVHATRAAIKEGIVPGGSLAYIKASIRVSEALKDLEGDERTGAAIVVDALRTPLVKIASNAGMEGRVVLRKVMEMQGIEECFGFDARTKTFCNMFDAGIIDPASVVSVAFDNALSISSTVINTETLIAHPVENEKNQAKS